jgi:hypothetical protein
VTPRDKSRPSPAHLHTAEAPKLGDKAAQAEKFLKAISNSHRLVILCEFLGGEKPVATLQATMDDPLLSRRWQCLAGDAIALRSVLRWKAGKDERQKAGTKSSLQQKQALKRVQQK